MGELCAFSLARQCIGCGVEEPVNLENLGLPISCLVGEDLSETLDSPVRGVGEVCHVEEVHQLFTARQIVGAVNVQAVDDSGSKGKASSLSHDHRRAFSKSGLDVDRLSGLCLKHQAQLSLAADLAGPASLVEAFT